jgi:chitodextrinase
MIPVGVIAQGIVRVPNAPTSFFAIPSTSSVILGWTAPSFNGGLPVTSYTLKRGATTIYTGAGTSFTDTGLTPYTEYSYTVVATNAIGNSATASEITYTTG